jgi:hypothetical protein
MLQPLYLESLYTLIFEVAKIEKFPVNEKVAGVSKTKTFL